MIALSCLSAGRFPQRRWIAGVTAGRNILSGPGFRNVNASLRRSIALTERTTLQLRGEFFNLFNQVNLGLPDNFVGSPSFGSVRMAESPRRIQLGVKLIF